nr:transposase [Candidatus Frankia alpina]
MVYYPPKLPVATLVNKLKGVPAYRLRQEFTGRANRARAAGYFWSPSYFAGSCGGAPLSVVAEYIENQKHPDEHLRRDPRCTGRDSPPL